MASLPDGEVLVERLGLLRKRQLGRIAHELAGVVETHVAGFRGPDALELLVQRRGKERELQRPEPRAQVFVVDEGREQEPLDDGVDARLFAGFPPGPRYDGSLTTPPCTEGVKWLVMTEPVPLSAEQIAAFTDLVGENRRSLQPLNGRSVVTDRITER